MKLSRELEEILIGAQNRARKDRAEFLIPEHIMLEIAQTEKFAEIFENLGGDMDILLAELNESLDELDCASI